MLLLIIDFYRWFKWQIYFTDLNRWPLKLPFIWSIFLAIKIHEKWHCTLLCSTLGGLLALLLTLSLMNALTTACICFCHLTIFNPYGARRQPHLWAEVKSLVLKVGIHSGQEYKLREKRYERNSLAAFSSSHISFPKNY